MYEINMQMYELLNDMEFFLWYLGAIIICDISPVKSMHKIIDYCEK